MPKKATKYTNTSPDRHKSKEECVEYAFKILNKYGNVFISENIKRMWNRDDLAAYLSAEMKCSVIIRNCHYMKNGCVAEINTKKPDINRKNNA